MPATVVSSALKCPDDRVVPCASSWPVFSSLKFGRFAKSKGGNKWPEIAAVVLQRCTPERRFGHVSPGATGTVPRQQRTLYSVLPGHHGGRLVWGDGTRVSRHSGIRLLRKNVVFRTVWE